MWVKEIARWMTILAVVLLVAGCNKPGTAGGNSAVPSPRDLGWPVHGGTPDEQRFSSLDQINTGNVDKLGLAWSVDFDTTRGQEATPIVVGRALFTSTAWSKVIAVDAPTGRVLWNFDPKVPGASGVKGCCDVVNRGVAYAGGKVFVGTFDGRLIALDAKTGRQLWSTQTLDPNFSYSITGAPRIVRDKVIIGNGGADLGARGYVTAYSVSTGKQIWRFYTVPGNPAKTDGAASDEALKNVAAPTWFGDQYWTFGGGGTVWDSIVYDEKLNKLYIGTGNGSPWDRKVRSEDKGDNLFLSSIVALDPDTGKYLWHYQETPGEEWDYTSTQQIMLVDRVINGRERHLIYHAPKNGFFYVIDRRIGKLVSAEKFVPANWADKVDLATGRPVENPKARYRNGAFLSTVGGAGGHNWQPMSYSPRTKLVYIPAQEIPLLYRREPGFRKRLGWNLGVDFLTQPLPADPTVQNTIKKSFKGYLLAWNPETQKEAWRVDLGQPNNGGTLVTAGDIVFQGTYDGRFVAYDARNGTKLWSFGTGNSVMPGAVSYLIDGVQYVSVLVGNGGGVSLALPQWPEPRASRIGRLLTFKLGGTAALAKQDETLQPLQIATGNWSPGAIEDGRKLFGQNCGVCHGAGTYSTGVLPDLKRSSYLKDQQAWIAVVLNGALQDQGMVAFKGRLSAANIENIRGYIGTEASRARRQEKR